MQRKWKRNWRKEALRRVYAGFLAGALLLGGYSTALAAPQGGTVAAGSAAISQNGALTTINQASQKAVINWNSFNIAKGETVRFNQPGASSIALNRVTGNNASAIYGTLSANGQVFLVNPNGVLFAKGAQVNVGGLAASTLGISDTDFLNGNYHFSGDSAKSVVNQGELSAAAKGYIALLGANVANEGVIVAKEGTAALGAGSKVNLDFSGDGLLQLSVDKEAVAALASNKGLIQADGGLVVMSAKSADALAGTVVNNSGVIEAKSVSTKNGVIRLEGGTNGTVVNSGTLNVSGLAAGQTGGTVKVLGDKVSLTETAVLNASGDAAGGTILAGGNYQGSGSEQRAQETTVAAGASLAADAVSSGNGGTVVVWADKNTNFGGTISAKGGSQSGNGGQVETSGKKTLTVQSTANVNTTAAKGKTGSWLLDPEDFTIGTGATGTNYWNNTALSTALNTSGITIATTLNQNTANGSTYNTTGGTGNGDINITAPLTWSKNKLTLSAYRNINIKSTLTANGTAALDMTSGTGGTIDYGLTASGFTGKVNFDRSGNNFLTINGTPYTVITSQGVAGSMTGTDLQGMTGNLSGKYFLGADIDASGTSVWNSNAGFAPIGNESNPFKGVFDGGGHTISSLTINRSGTNDAGLFGDLQSAHIANVGLKTVNITGYNRVGGLTGSSSGSSITNSYATGSVTGGSYIGGLVGQSFAVASTITNSYAESVVTGTSSGSGTGYVGGLVGSMIGTITNSYATGDVAGVNYVGGLAGSASGTVSGSYATGGVTGTTYYVGGLVGAMNGSITKGYAVGGVSGSKFVGGLVGTQSSGSISDSYAEGGVVGNGATYVGGLVGKMNGNITNSHAIGTASGNLDVGGLVGNMDGAIENSYATGDVSGTAGVVGGLVGGQSSGDITNSHAIGSVSGKNYVGGLVGLQSSGSISDSYAEGSVTGTGNDFYYGGLVGVVGGSITKSYATGGVSGANCVGGLVGYGGIITNSYATGSVTGTGNSIGGLVGGGGTITNSYAMGSVTGTGNNIGGLVGSGGSVTNSYWDKEKSGQEKSAGGTGLTTEDIKNAINYSNWDTTDVWYLNGSQTAPLLRSFLTPLTVSAISTTKVYDGSAAAPSGVSRTPASGPYDPSKVDGTLAWSGNGDAGSYGLTGLYATSQQGYLINYDSSATLTITKKTLTLNSSRVYDGTTAAASSDFTGGIINGVNGQTLQLSGMGTLAGKNVGTQSLTSLGTLALADGTGKASNYTLALVGSSVNITTRPLLASVTAENKVYDGTTAATINGDITLGNVVSGETISAAYTSGAFADKNVGDNKTVILSGVSLSGAGASNYSLAADSITSNASITKAPLTLSGSRVYDGTATANASLFVTGGVLVTGVNGETLGLAGTGALVSKNAGDSGVALSDTSGLTLLDGTGKASNYTLGGGSVIISKAPLTITAAASSKTYDGTTVISTLPTVLGSVYDAQTLSESYSDPNAGSGKTLTPQIVFANSADAANYNLTLVNNSAGVITSATLYYTATPTSMIQGSSLPTLTGTITGLKGSDSVTDVTQGTATWSTTATQTSPVGRYNIDGAGVTLKNGNYTLEQAAANATALTIQATPAPTPTPAFSSAYAAVLQGVHQQVANGGPGEADSGGGAPTTNLRYTDGSTGRTLSVSGAEVTIGGGLIQVNMGAANSDVAVYTPGGQRTVYRFDAAHSVLSLREESQATGAAPVTVAGVGESAPFELLDAAGHIARFVLEYYGSGATVTAQNEAARGMLNQPQLITAAALAAGQDQLGLEAEEMKELLLR